MTCFCSVILYLNRFEFWPHFNWDMVYVPHTLKTVEQQQRKLLAHHS